MLPVQSNVSFGGVKPTKLVQPKFGLFDIRSLPDSRLVDELFRAPVPSFQTIEDLIRQQGLSRQKAKIVPGQAGHIVIKAQSPGEIRQLLIQHFGRPESRNDDTLHYKQQYLKIRICERGKVGILEAISDWQADRADAKNLKQHKRKRLKVERRRDNATQGRGLGAIRVLEGPASKPMDTGWPTTTD